MKIVIWRPSCHKLKRSTTLEKIRLEDKIIKKDMLLILTIQTRKSINSQANHVQVCDKNREYL